jgi:hypothetical protein
MFTGGGGSGLETFNVGLSVALFFVFIFLLHANIIQDAQDEKKLDKIVCHKEVDLPKIRGMDKLVIESVIEEYWKKRSMNKSNCAKIWNDMRTGFVRGALGGAIVGGGWGGSASGAIVFSTLSGLSRAYNLTYGKSSFLRDNKHT